MLLQASEQGPESVLSRNGVNMGILRFRLAVGHTPSFVGRRSAALHVPVPELTE